MQRKECSQSTEAAIYPEPTWCRKIIELSVKLDLAQDHRHINLSFTIVTPPVDA